MTERPVRSSRRPLVYAVLVLVAWFGIGAVGGQSIGQLSQLQKNDNASFLPEDAESTRAAEAAATFSDSATLPLIVVAERPGGLTPADLQAGQALAQALPSRTVELDGPHPISDYLATSQVAAVPSEDGQAFIVVLPLDSQKIDTPVGESTPLQAVADEVRAVVEKDLGGIGLEAHVTGPAGFVSDLVTAFGGIDGILLAVALGVVLVILLVVYRSPVLPFAVLLTAVFGLAAAGLVVYRVAEAGWVTVSGQSQGILSILVVGAATDYSLLLVARYKEELHRSESVWTAMTRAWRRTVEPIAASAGTVILGLLALMLADLNSTSGLGPVGALGIVGAVLAALTFLPAVLLLGRRWIFWPSVPRVDPEHGSDDVTTRRGWGRVAALVSARPRATWVATTIVLAGAAAFLPTLKADGIAQSDLFLTKVDSVTGQEVLARHFDAGSGSPVLVITPSADAERVVERLATEDGVQDPFIGLTPPAPPGTPGAPAAEPQPVDGRQLVQATLTEAADSPAAADTVRRLRADLDAISPDIIVGGQTAQSLDVRDAAGRDLRVIVPTITLVVFLVLVLLLRSLVAPLLLVAANILSFGAAMGISALVFNHVFGFAGGDPTTVLYGFVFLVALGVDYSIFLMTRAREESALHGTRTGVARALAVTGGVITSAGIVLAATFGALAIIPLLFLAQIAFIVAFGVLTDTFIVRSLLVPAAAIDLGERTWWPIPPRRPGRHSTEGAPVD